MSTNIWIYQANRNINEQEADAILLKLHLFIENWQTHGKPMSGIVQLYKNRFIVVQSNDAVTEASGCSIDSLTHEIKQLEEEYHLGLLNRMLVSISDDSNEIQTYSLPEFKQKVKEGAMNPNTVIYNLNIVNSKDFPEKFEQIFSESWAKSLV